MDGISKYNYINGLSHAINNAERIKNLINNTNEYFRETSIDFDVLNTHKKLEKTVNTYIKQLKEIIEKL